MKRFFWLLFVLALSSVFASAQDLSPGSGVATSPGDRPKGGLVIVVPLRSEVSEAQFYFLRRALKTAERDKAAAFIIDMETYGGEVKAAIDNMQALLKSSVPTYTYVNTRAISAGALIAMATQKIYMAPSAVIGAAAPVMSGGEDLPKTMTDKTVSAVSAMARAAAQQNGHNPDIADAFIDKAKELKVDSVVIDGSDSLLTLSAQEAVKLYSGKPLLAEGVANSLGEMLQMAGLDGVQVRRIEPTGFERLAIWVTALAPLLLLGGIIGAYIEFKVPGFGLPGILSIICFTLFFTGHFVAGLAGWEAVVCFSIGVALVFGELLVHPGTVLPGVVGVLLMLASLIYAMVDRWPNEPLWPTQEMLVWPLVNVSVAMVAAGVVAYLVAKHLPDTALYQRLVLAETVPGGPALEPAVPATHVAVGVTGVAQTTLRPSGKAVFAGQLTDVVSLGEFIESGTPVRVVQIEGSRVVIEPV